MEAPVSLQSPRTTVRRMPARGLYDEETVHAILDEALVCHLGFVHEGQPMVLPTIHVRVGDRIYLHGSAASRMLKAAATGIPVCLTVTLLDGLVLARSAFHHSMNYRSAVVLGTASLVADDAEKKAALEALVEHVVPGRAAEVRPPSVNELKGTIVLRLPLTEASAKVRTGPPADDEEDYALACWAGVVPLSLAAQEALPDPRLAPGTPVPAAVAPYSRRAGAR